MFVILCPNVTSTTLELPKYIMKSMYEFTEKNVV